MSRFKLHDWELRNLGKLAYSQENYRPGAVRVRGEKWIRPWWARPRAGSVSFQGCRVLLDG